MFFKKGFCISKTTLVGIVILFLFSGCSKEDVPYIKPGYVSFGNQICVDKFTNSIERFVFADLSSTEVSEFWNCIDRGVKLFKTYVRGASPGRINKQELSNFLHFFFVKDRVMSDSLLLELMKMKVLFLGGSTDYILNKELIAADALVKNAKELSLDLLPYVKLLSLPYQDEGFSTRNVLPVDKALFVLEKSLKKMAQIISANNASYRFSDLLALVDELDEFLTYEDPVERFKKIRVYIPLISRFKGLLRDNSADLITADEWSPVMKLFSDAYSIYVRYLAHVDGKTFWSGDGLDQLTKIIKSGEILIQAGLRNQSDHNFSSTEVKKVFDAIPGTEVLPLQISSEDLLSLWTTLVDKMLSDGMDGSSGFQNGHLLNIVKEYNIWLETQRQINSSFSVHSPKNSCKRPFFKEDRNKPGMIELKKIVDCAPWAINMDRDSRLYLDYDIKKMNLDTFAISTVNWQRAFLRILIRGYARDKKRRDERIGLTEGELKELYVDIKPLLRALDLVAKEDSTYYKNIFRDSKFFMPQSNGDKIIDFSEGIEYFYGASSGSQVADEMLPHLKLQCPYKEKIGDRFGGPFFDMKCFRKEISLNFSKFYFHLPEMAWYQNSLTEDKWEALVDRAIKLTGYMESEAPYMSLHRIVEFSVFLQYIETFMVRFDRNGDRYLNISESAMALPIFTGSLKSVSSSDEAEEDPEGSFTWMLNQKGKVDEKSERAFVVEKKQWMEYPKQRSFTLSRGDLVKTIFNLKDIMD